MDYQAPSAYFNPPSSYLTAVPTALEGARVKVSLDNLSLSLQNLTLSLHSTSEGIGNKVGESLRGVEKALEGLKTNGNDNDRITTLEKILAPQFKKLIKSTSTIESNSTKLIALIASLTETMEELKVETKSGFKAAINRDLTMNKTLERIESRLKRIEEGRQTSNSSNGFESKVLEKLEGVKREEMTIKREISELKYSQQKLSKQLSDASTSLSAVTNLAPMLHQLLLNSLTETQIGPDSLLVAETQSQLAPPPIRQNRPAQIQLQTTTDEFNVHVDSSPESSAPLTRRPFIAHKNSTIESVVNESHQPSWSHHTTTTSRSGPSTTPATTASISTAQLASTQPDPIFKPNNVSLSSSTRGGLKTFSSAPESSGIQKEEYGDRGHLIDDINRELNRNGGGGGGTKKRRIEQAASDSEGEDNQENDDSGFIEAPRWPEPATQEESY